MWFHFSCKVSCRTRLHWSDFAFCECSAQGHSTGIVPSDRQGSYVIDASSQAADDAQPRSSRTWEKFWLEAEDVQQLLQDNHMDEDELLQSLITPASSLARPPISSFHVGCAMLCLFHFACQICHQAVCMLKDFHSLSLSIPSTAVACHACLYASSRAFRHMFTRNMCMTAGMTA